MLHYILKVNLEIGPTESDIWGKGHWGPLGHEDETFRMG
jgi:hypothetical protein